MLLQLTIHDLVIVDRLALEFEAGLSVLTGETGAGKSILLDALGLTLGGKASTDVIRTGCKQAEVHSLFGLDDSPAAQQWLAEHDLADADQCILRRIVVRNGRSRASINGRPVTQAMLQALGELLLNIHGQHAHQALLRPAAQRQLLDTYGDLQAQVKQLGGHYRSLKQAEAALDLVQQAARERGNRLDYLRFQLNELEPVLETAANINALEAEHHRLAHAAQLQTASTQALQQLQGGEHELNAQLNRLISQIHALVDIDPELRPTLELLESAAIQVDEATQGLRWYVDQLEIDPEQLQRLDTQLVVPHDLALKHRVDIQQLPELADRLQHELDTLVNVDQQETDLAAEVKQYQQTYDQQAQALSQARQAAAQRLAETVQLSMQTLGMQQGRFQIDCTAGAPGKQGKDQVQFLVATNPGQPLAPLARVASGGELSRIALAIQVATSGCSQVPTLIFDEVDVGIGGAVADMVGQLLRRLGQQTQVICVTHLAQVAAQAHQHYQVRKQLVDAQSQTMITALHAEQRVDEVARMLGGVTITEQSRRHAAEMITLGSVEE